MTPAINIILSHALFAHCRNGSGYHSERYHA